VVHLKVPGLSAAGAERRLPEGALADRVPARAAAAETRRPAEMALVTGSRAKSPAGIGAARQDRPRETKRTAAGRADPFDRLRRVAARQAAELLSAARRRREFPAAVLAGLAVPIRGTCAVASLQRRSCGACSTPRRGVVGPHVLVLAARRAGPQTGRAVPRPGGRRDDGRARRSAVGDGHGRGGVRRSGGCRWLPDSGCRAGLQAGSSGYQRCPVERPAFIGVCVGSGGSGVRVASQKSGPVAGDVPRFARQHRKTPRKEPIYQRLGSSDPDWSPRWTPEASDAASACALFSRAY